MAPFWGLEFDAQNDTVLRLTRVGSDLPLRVRVFLLNGLIFPQSFEFSSIFNLVLSLPLHNLAQHHFKLNFIALKHRNFDVKIWKNKRGIYSLPPPFFCLFKIFFFAQIVFINQQSNFPFFNLILGLLSLKYKRRISWFSPTFDLFI